VRNTVPDLDPSSNLIRFSFWPSIRLFWRNHTEVTRNVCGTHIHRFYTELTR
jgi:hypothetical protein